MISIRNLKKFFRGHQRRIDALKGINLEVGEGEFCVLLGPSGCGKTTTLRCVAGLERPDGGEIEIGGKPVNSPARRIFVAAEKREIGMVFQSYAIWPHMNVFQNVAFPLTQGQKRISKSEAAEKVGNALKRVRLDGLEDRPATDLSGGQQQRVAMARAMVTDAKVLLMDEPLSNLDARLREQMRVELKKITKSIGVTTLYVTHDQAEALSLGDKVCVMNQGEILQTAEPNEIYARPINLFVAQFVGEMNFVKGTVTGARQVESLLGVVQVALPNGASIGSSVTLAIRPEHVSLQAVTDPTAGPVRGKVTSKNYLGDAALLEVEVNGVPLLAKLAGDSDISAGQPAAVDLPSHRWHVFP
jgi:iron(III) transport system ATP-binding protein